MWFVHGSVPKHCQSYILYGDKMLTSSSSSSPSASNRCLWVTSWKIIYYAQGTSSEKVTHTPIGGYCSELWSPMIHGASYLCVHPEKTNRRDARDKQNLIVVQIVTSPDQAHTLDGRQKARQTCQAQPYAQIATKSYHLPDGRRHDYRQRRQKEQRKIGSTRHGVEALLLIVVPTNQEARPYGTIGG